MPIDVLDITELTIGGVAIGGIIVLWREWRAGSRRGAEIQKELTERIIEESARRAGCEARMEELNRRIERLEGKLF